ncbi:hypothetical protein [Arthrobacter sp. UYEF20]|uniref:hypothetical protein n=1 Tax=Arthrobacter sp. UYEF20 TaxID=1756363 RepID=UPI00339A29D9
MNEQANGQLHAPSQDRANGGPAHPAGFEDAPRFTVDKANGKTGKKNEAVLGPFTIRDLTVFGSTLVLFIASLIPMFAVSYNLWNLGSLFFLGLGILLPLIVSALFVARRVSPGTRIWIGSLSVDQFASVVASFAVAFFFLAVAGAYVPSMLLALVGALGLFAATVLARLVPYFAGDFLDRNDAPAHVVARQAAVPVRKPRAPKTPKEPKEAKEPKEHKESATGAVAGWAKRMTPRGQAAAPEAAPRGQEPPGPASSDAVPGTAAATPSAATPSAGAAAAGPSAGTAAATPSAGPAAPPAAVTQAAAAQGSAPAQAAAAPATQVSGVVPSAPSAASGPSAPSAAEPTQVSGVVTPAANSAAAADAEQTRVADVPASTGTGAPTTVNPQVRSQEPIGATVDPASRPEQRQAQPVHEAFWFAVAQPRTAVDEHTGAPAFVIEPGGWVLALEDRGHEFLVQHTDGRVGVLRDLSNIERG